MLLHDTSADSGGAPSQSSNESITRGIEDIVKDLGIPPRPVILEHLAQEATKPEPDFNHMAHLIERDVALSASLLKTVNAPYFGLRQKVRNVREALIFLGLPAASRAIAGVILRRLFPPGPHLERFWDASDRTAQLSGWLVHELGPRHGARHEDVYTFALFRNCGIPIMMRRFTGYKDILARANATSDKSFTQVEDEALPTNHSVVGALMAEGWWLPEATVLAIRNHHEVSSLMPGSARIGLVSRQLIAVAQLAEWLMQQATGMNKNNEWAKLGEACLAQLDMPGTDLAALELRAAAFLDSLDPL